MTDTAVIDSTHRAPRKRRAKKVIAVTENLPAVQPPRTFTEIVLHAAADASVDPVKFRAMVNVVAESNFHVAMLAMQAELPSIDKDGRIVLKPGTRPIAFTSYEKLNGILRPVLNKHEFTLEHSSSVDPEWKGFLLVHTELTHGRNGEPVFTKSTTLPVPTTRASPAMNEQQALGAAFAYGKRYNTIGLLNIQTEAVEDRDTDATEIKFITGKQAKAFSDRLAALEIAEDRFCKAYGIPSIDKLPAAQFAQADQAITTKEKASSHVRD